MDAGPIEIEARGIEKAFGAHVVLKDVSLTVRSGDIVAIVGASGSGKTVLLDILTGLVHPDAGLVRVADHGRGGGEEGRASGGAPLVDLFSLGWEELDAVRLHWSIVFQRNALFSGTVYENLALWFREHTDLTEAQIEARARTALASAALDVSDVLFKQREELSGGMAKRVAIARAISVDPIVMFYDEPTTGLDPIIGAQVHELIYAQHHRPHPDGMPRTTIIVTHDKELLRRVRPRVVMLHRAGVCFDGTYEEFEASEHPAAREYLRAMPVLHARE